MAIEDPADNFAPSKAGRSSNRILAFGAKSYPGTTLAASGTVLEGAGGGAVLAGTLFKCGGSCGRAIRSSVFGLRWAATISARGIPIICPLESDDTVDSILPGRTRWTDEEVLALAVTASKISVGNDGVGFTSSGDVIITSVLASFRLFSRTSVAGRLAVETFPPAEEAAGEKEALGLRSDVG